MDGQYSTLVSPAVPSPFDPNSAQYYNFSQTNTYSDLDTEFWEARLYGRYYVMRSLYLTAGYQYLDYQDNAPYLYDTTGSVDIYNLGVGWSF